MADGEPTVTVTANGMALASIPADRGVMHVNTALLKEIYISVLQKGPGAPLTAGEAFAVTVYLARNSMEEM